MLLTAAAAAAVGDSRPTTPWPTHAQKAPQVSVRLQTHARARAHTTHAQLLAHTWAWHRPGTMWDTPRHMHTGLDRQAAGSVSRAVPQMSTRRRGSRGSGLPVGGRVTLWFLCIPWCQLTGPWRKTRSPGDHKDKGCSREPSARHHSWPHARCTGLSLLPTASSLSRGIEFST